MQTTRLTRRQVTARLALVDRKILALDTILLTYADTFNGNIVSNAVRTAWNAASDARDALCRERADVEANRPDVPLTGTAALVA